VNLVETTQIFNERLYTQFAWLQAPAEKHIKIALLWCIMQRVVAFSHPCLGTAFGHYSLRNKLEECSLIYTDWVAKSQLENPLYLFTWSVVLKTVCHLLHRVGIVLMCTAQFVVCSASGRRLSNPT